MMTASENVLRVSLASAISLALLVGIASAAMAKDRVVVYAPPEDALTERVSYADLNLTTPGGVDRLNARVRSAVGHVCSPLDQGGPMRTELNDCKSFAWTGAQPQIGRAIERAHDIAANGTSMIPPVAIVIAVPAR